MKSPPTNHVEKHAKATINVTYFSWHLTYQPKTASSINLKETLHKKASNVSKNQLITKIISNQVFAAALLLFFGKVWRLILKMQASAKINASQTQMISHLMTIAQTQRGASFLVPVRGVLSRTTNRFSFTIASKVREYFL